MLRHQTNSIKIVWSIPRECCVFIWTEFFLAGKNINVVVHRDLFLVLLFIIYINDLPLVSKKLDFILFANDTNLTAVGMQVFEVEQELKKISKWLSSKKFALNLDKTAQMNVIVADDGSDSFSFIEGKKKREQFVRI